MKGTPLVLALVLLLAGCLGGKPAAKDEGPVVAQSAAKAGAVAGPAPSAPQEPFQVRAATDGTDETPAVTAYPLKLPTSKAKAPLELKYDGQFNSTDCTGLSLSPALNQIRFYNLSPSLQRGDVIAYDIKLTFENTDANWAEVHVGFGMGARNEFHSDPVATARGKVTQNFTGQSYRVGEGDPAWVIALPQ